jgi:DNA-binding MarR family transcriptional regulator
MRPAAKPGMNSGRETLRAWLALLSAAERIKKDIDARMRARFGLSISRFDVLAALDRAGDTGLTAGGLTEYLRVTEGNTTQVTAPLIKDGLVRRTVSETDGRVAIFALTRRGRRIFDEMAEINRAWVAEAFAPLNPAQIALLHDLLHELNHPPQPEKEAA